MSDLKYPLAAEVALGGTTYKGCAVKTVFAENELLAEDLLSQMREPLPETGEGY